MTWIGRPSSARKRGAQRLVAAHDLVEGALEGGRVERPVELDGERDVVERAARLELVEEPEPLLGERSGQRASSRGAGRDRRCVRASADLLELLEPRGEAGDGGRLEQGPQRELDVEGVAEPRDDLGGQERVAAELEEVVVDADPFAPRTCAQICATSASASVARRLVRLARGGELRLGSGQGVAVDLAVGRQRQGVERGRRRRGPWTRAALA